MLARVQQPLQIGHEDARLGDQLEQLQAENARLRSENRELRGALDAYLSRARATPLYGPVEMTAGTCVGPRRQRREARQNRAQ